jgi:opacity protein-like surface antigen
MHRLVCGLRCAIGICAAIRAYHFFVLVGHLLEKSGKGLTTVFA